MEDAQTGTYFLSFSESAVLLFDVGDDGDIGTVEGHRLSSLRTILRASMERVGGIEPPSPAWKAGVIAFIRYPRAIR